jgi:hypothetical protein
VLVWHTQDQRNRKSNDRDSALTLAGAFQVRNRAAGTAFYGSQSLLGASR